MPTRRAALLLAVLSLVLALGTFVVPGPAPLDAQAARSLSATPADDLENQVVEVTWSGFTPTVDDSAFTVTLFQCKGAMPASLDDCFQTAGAAGGELGNAIFNGITKPDGTGNVRFEVRPSFQLPELGCSTTQPCSIVAFENDGAEYPATGLPATAAVVALDFARSPTDCPRVDTPDVTVSGEASAAYAMSDWASRTCTATQKLAIDFTESNSNEGRENFLGGLRDVGVTSVPAGQSEAAAAAHPFAYAPVDLTSLVIGFNVFDAVTREPITEMNLTPRLVAAIIARDPFATIFTDPEFLAINPGHDWPSNTLPPLLRGERNGDAMLLTRWLQSDGAARAFLDGEDSAGLEVDPFWKGITYPTDLFEARNPNYIDSYKPLSGTAAVARRLLNFQGPNAAGIPGFDGVFAVVDGVTASRFGFHVAKLKAASASTALATDPSGFVAPDTTALTAAYDKMTKLGSTPSQTFLQADVSATGTYPLVKVDYAMVPIAGTSVAKAANIARLLDYAAGDGQQPAQLDPGYVALSEALKAQTSSVSTLVREGGDDSVPPTDPGDPAVPDTPFDPGLGPDPGFDPGIDAGSIDPGTLPPDSIAPADDGGGRGRVGKPDADESAAGVPISHFSGGDGQGILPAILLVGLIALVVGPGSLLWGRRTAARAAATDASDDPEVGP